MYTDIDGKFEIELEEGTYTVSEELPPYGSHWVQTYPQTNLYEFTLPDDDPVNYLLFGNVCEMTFECGRTPGFWSNKNGKAILDNNPGWMSLLSDLNLVNANGYSFDPANYTQFRNWILSANATNMSYMLSAQLAAFVLNLNYICPDDFDPTAFGVVFDGEWKSLADLVYEANELLLENPVCLDGDPDRYLLEMYKNMFDRLNNRYEKIIPYEPCPVPVWE